MDWVPRSSICKVKLRWNLLLCKMRVGDMHFTRCIRIFRSQLYSGLICDLFFFVDMILKIEVQKWSGSVAL